MLRYFVRRKGAGNLPGALFLMILITVTAARTQVFEWARMGGGPGWKHGNGIAVDTDGSSYVVGEFSGSNAIMFGNAPITCEDSSSTAAFIAKYNASGDFQWVQTLHRDNTGGKVTAKSIAFHDNTLYVTGKCEGDVDFGSNIHHGIAPGSSFVAKYNLTPTMPPTAEWVVFIEPMASIQPPSNVQSNGIAIGGNTVFICGGYKGNLKFESKNDLGNSRQESSSDTTLFVAAYSMDGTFNNVWATAGAGNAVATSIAATEGGVAVVTGHFTGNITINTQPSTTLYNSINPNIPSLIVARVSVPNPNIFDWVSRGFTTSSSTDFAEGNGVAIDVGTNFAYVVGSYSGDLKFNGSAVIDPNYDDLFLVKYRLMDGVSIWARAPEIDNAGMATRNGVDVHDGNPFVTGSFSGAITFGDVGKRIAFASIGNHDILVARYGIQIQRRRFTGNYGQRRRKRSRVR